MVLSARKEECKQGTWLPSTTSPRDGARCRENLTTEPRELIYWEDIFVRSILRHGKKARDSFFAPRGWTGDGICDASRCAIEGLHFTILSPFPGVFRFPSACKSHCIHLTREKNSCLSRMSPALAKCYHKRCHTYVLFIDEYTGNGPTGSLLVQVRLNTTAV